MGFVGEHPLFRPPAATPFLPANLFDAGALGRYKAALQRFNFVEKQTPGDETIDALLACGLTFHLQAGGTMQQHHAGRGLVDVLTALATGTDEGFLEVGFASNATMRCVSCACRSGLTANALIG
jgi:hypothetical protein